MISAIVLAAGLSTRMGKPKQILPMGGQPMLERVLFPFRQAMVDEIVVVLGADAAKVRKMVKLPSVRTVVNRDYRRGMGSSVRVGLAAANHKAEAVIIALGDQPFLSASTVERIVEGYRNTGALIVVPTFQHRRGNPVLFDRSVFPQIMKIEGDVGAKAVIERNAKSVLEVPVEDRGVLLDVDTPSDYGEANKRVRSIRRRRGRGGA